ncbi:hypothetical protein Sjap_002756 [Stephania japonica]|uniref:Uncharacterized protein n=1 Tax=Stephania japonica TaxID=461633 RepID=A0AAP0PWF0_9MAGN
MYVVEKSQKRVRVSELVTWVAIVQWVDVILEACVPLVSSCASAVTLLGKSQLPLSVRSEIASFDVLELLLSSAGITLNFLSVAHRLVCDGGCRFIRKRSTNTISAIPLNSVEVKDEEYMSDYEESKGELEVSQSEPEIVMAQTYEEEAEKEIEVTLTRLEDLQQESKDEQSFVLVNPPTLPYIFDDFNMEVDETERLKPFCTADTFVLDDLDITDSYVLEVPDKLPFLNRCIYVSLPNARGESIILGYSLLEGIT